LSYERWADAAGLRRRPTAETAPRRR